MRNHPKEVGIAEFVGPLQKDLELAKDRVPENSEIEKLIDQINTKVLEVKDILNDREKSDRELVGYFEKIQRQIDPWMDYKPREKPYVLPKKTEVGESSNTSYQMDVSEVQEFFETLDPLLNRYLTSLLVFPENIELKKSLVIYWWITLSWPIIEDYERLFSDLVEKKVLRAVHRKHNKVIDRFTIEPFFRKLLISNSERYGHLYYEKWEEGSQGTSRLYFLRQVLLNLNQRYLNSNHILMEITSKNELEVVQLGSWCYPKTKLHKGVEKTGSAVTESIDHIEVDHIEVDQTDFLKKLGKDVKCISLRGISGIVELDESIGKLEFLKILDLRACHNLQKLPQKPESTLIRRALNKDRVWFRNLMVLDISECYLLDNMPKWVCELSNLEVLKGFVVGNLGNKKQSCRLGDLSKLNKLRKLSIRIVINMLDPDVFWGFDSLDSLLILTITWGENKFKEIPTYSLPKNLEKLDIRCYPGDDASKWNNPEDLINLKRLYIRGGNLTKIPFHNNWQVLEILRLRFMEKLNCQTDWKEFMGSFKNLKYVEFVNCCKPKNFPNDGDNWRECNYEEGESSNSSYQNDKEFSKFQKLVDSLHSLHPMGSKRLKSLIIFPENTELKKRLVIYWWSVLFGGDTEINERIFSNMVHEEVFIPIHREHNKVIDRVIIKPSFYRWLLISNGETYGRISYKKREEGSWHLLKGEPRDRYCTILLNLDKRYLDSWDIMDISRGDDLQLVQLGSWRCTETEVHKNDHIEVNNTYFLNRLGEKVKYLSLRGISGIAELHESIAKLEYLEILDLRACYDLIKLPQKPRPTFYQKFTETSWFNRLIVLDISECYLLDNMPKWICELSNLEVLKGFVVGSWRYINPSCQLGDLSKLNKLRKLSIRIAINMLDPYVFWGFNSLDTLLILTITWGENKFNEIPAYLLPKNLEKLDMRRYPEAEVLSKLQNPGELTKLKRLYIRGGNLTKIPCFDNWKVEILRLRFLKRLVYPTDWEELRHSFKNLKYVEYVECPHGRPENFPNDGNTWRNEE